MKPPEQKPKLNIKKETPHSLDKADKIFQELREAHWKNKEMIDREMLDKYPEVLDKRLDKYDGYLNDFIKINYPADEIRQIKQDFDDIKKLRLEYDLLWGLDNKDMEEAKKIKKQINTKLAELEVSFNQSISGRTPEGKEVNIVLSAEIASWNQFYQKYEIKDDQGEICQLSDNLRLTPDQIAQAQQDIERFGFDTVLIIPAGIKPIDLLNNDQLQTYPENEKMYAEKMKEADEATDPAKKEELKKDAMVILRYLDSDIPSELLEKPTTQTQIILLKNSPDVYQDDNWDSHNQKFPAVLDKEKELGIKGLDISSFLFFHRSHYDQTLTETGKGIHPHVWKINQAQSTWLTKTATGGERCAEAEWSLDIAKLNFRWRGSDFYFSDLGAVFSRSLEIERNNSI